MSAVRRSLKCAQIYLQTPADGDTHRAESGVAIAGNADSVFLLVDSARYHRSNGVALLHQRLKERSSYLLNLRFRHN